MDKNTEFQTYFIPLSA